MNFATLATDVFQKRAEARFDDPAEERAAIALAKAGDSDATVALVLAYAPTLRKSVRAYTSAMVASAQSTDHEDVHSAAITGLIEAIHAFDAEKHERLSYLAAQYVTNAVSEIAHGATGFTVPERTLKRFFGILRAAGGDVNAAADLAPSHEMKRETFLAVLSAVRDVDSYDAAVEDDEGERFESGGAGSVEASPLWDGSHADAEDRILVEAAFRAVDRLETDVVGLAYGFTEYDPQPDAEIGARLGLSRPKTQRVRASALAKMRTSLGVVA